MGSEVVNVPASCYSHNQVYAVRGTSAGLKKFMDELRLQHNRY